MTYRTPISSSCFFIATRTSSYVEKQAPFISDIVNSMSLVATINTNNKNYDKTYLLTVTTNVIHFRY